MWPYLVELQTAGGPFPIPTYGMMMVMAFTLAFLLVHRRARRIGVHPDRLIPVYVAAALGGLVGARLLYTLAIDPSALLQPAKLFSAGGFAFYGGLLGGAAGVFGIAAFTGVVGWKLADLLAPGLLVGLGVGRLGCFLAGCCHGSPVHLSDSATPLLSEGTLKGQIWLDGHFPFVATEFHAGVGRLHDLPLYPTQLWSAAAGLGLAAMLSWAWTRRRFDGQVIGLMLVTEPVFRFLIESFRADERGYAITWPIPDGWADALPPGLTAAGAELGDAAVMGLTTSQGIGLGMVALGVGILVARRNAGVLPETPIEEDDF